MGRSDSATGGRVTGTGRRRGTMVRLERPRARGLSRTVPSRTPAMPLTDDQRRAICRENAQKSTGPKTEEGKARSRTNAMKHGLRAEVVALPQEDPDEVEARSRAWNDHYQPGSPAAQHLVNQCVQATLLADRVHRYHVAAVSARVVEAQAAWDLAREGEVDQLVDLMAKEPAEAVAGLRRTDAGRRWMIGRWEELGRMLDDRGYWTDYERNEAVRMLGLRPEPHHMKGQPGAWLTRLSNLLCRPEPSGTAVGAMFAPDRMPGPLRASYRLDALPDPDACRRSLDATVADQIALLNAGRDDPARAAAGDRALIATDAPTATGPLPCWSRPWKTTGTARPWGRRTNPRTNPILAPSRPTRGRPPGLKSWTREGMGRRRGRGRPSAGGPPSPRTGRRGRTRRRRGPR